MNNEVLIPKNWRDQVVSILKTEDKSRILFTLDCRNRWQARFPSASHYQLYDALIEALSDDDITGIEIFDMDEGYETWKFFFHARECEIIRESRAASQ